MPHITAEMAAELKEWQELAQEAREPTSPGSGKGPTKEVIDLTDYQVANEKVVECEQLMVTVGDK